MFEPALINLVQSFRTPFFDTFFKVVTSLGSEYFYIALILALYWTWDRKKAADLAVLFLISMWVNGLLKDWFYFPRPLESDGVSVLVHETSPGFPSGHAQGSMTLWGYLFINVRYLPARAFFVLLIALISLSRIYLGVHFPGDIAGGLLAGLVMLGLYLLLRGRSVSVTDWTGAVIATLGAVVLLYPLGTSVAYQTLGFLLGLVLTGPLAAGIPYRQCRGAGQFLGRLAIGYSGFALLYVLHALFLPNGLLELFGYALVAAWVTVGAPYVMARAGLAPPFRVPSRGRPALTILAVYLVLCLVLSPLEAPVRTFPFDDGAAEAVAGGNSLGRLAVIAHRGGAGELPENTLQAFAAALEQGADFLELDLQLTADGVPVVIHDETLDRTTDGEGLVRDRTLAEIKILDAAYWFKSGSGEYPYRGAGYEVPAFSEVLEAFPDARFIIELKDPDAVLPTLRVLREWNALDRVILASFDDGTIERTRREAPGIPTAFSESEATAFVILSKFGLGFLYDPPGETLQVPERSGAIRVVTEGLMRAAHDRGLRVYVWTVNDQRSMERLASLGIDGIITDEPRLLRQLKDGYR